MNRGKLRIIGTSATLTEELRLRAQKDLPFEIEFNVLDGVSCLRRGVLSPESYDVYDQWFYSLDLLWTAGSIQQIDTARIDSWPHVRVAGKVPGAASGSGNEPANQLFVQPDGTLGPTHRHTDRPQIGMLPTTYNVDSFAYRRELLSMVGPEAVESWAWLIDDRWHGRATISLDPAGSAVELALAARSAGLVDLRDPGDLSTEEIDALFDLLRSLKRRGHFTRFWGSAEDSVGLMTSPSMIGSLWSPAFYTLRGMGEDLLYAVPREGYRGWHSGLCLSARASEEASEMAYAYMNWWLAGEPGAIMARQGYYISVTEPLSRTLSDAEWRYWYGGEPAANDLPGISGQIVVRKGQSREGGGHRERIGRVAVWSTIMPEHNYLARRWREFIEL
jgi:putative spermidine/putrescine transport system substrate-binding protein